MAAGFDCSRLELLLAHFLFHTHQGVSSVHPPASSQPRLLPRMVMGFYPSGTISPNKSFPPLVAFGPSGFFFFFFFIPAVESNPRHGEVGCAAEPSRNRGPSGCQFQASNL